MDNEGRGIMKKLIYVFIVLFTLIPMYVKAEEVYIDGDYLDDYVHISNALLNKDIRIRKHIYNDGFNKLGYTLDIWDNSTLDNDTLDRIKVIAYYGYGYNRHTDIKWYSITQYLIWETINNDTDISFVGNKYKDEIKELELLVSSYDILPSFADATVPISEELNKVVITDNNNVLSNYSITNNDGLEVNTKGNDVIVTGHFPKEHYISFTSLYNYMYTNKPKLYDNFLYPGSIIKSFNVSLSYPRFNLKLSLRDKETGLPMNDMLGTKIKIGNIIHTFIYCDLPQRFRSGTYKIEFIEVPVGYILPEDFEFELNDDKEVIIYLEKNKPLDLNREEIEVPNTYLKTDVNYNLYYFLLVLIGLFLIGKRKHEQD